MTDPKKLDLSGIAMPKKPETEEEIGKAYLESMIMLPAILQTLTDMLDDMTNSLSVIGAYYEKKGIEEGLFTSDDFSGKKNEQ